MAEPSQGMLAKLAPFLLGGGAGLLASRGDVAGLGPGLLQGGELAQQQLLNRIRLEQAEQLKREQAEKEAQAARERAIAQGAPAEQRLLAEAFPEAYAASQLKPAPSKMLGTVYSGQNRISGAFDPATGGFEPIGQGGPAFNPNAQTQINMPPMERESEKATGKYFGELFGKINDEGLKASSSINNLNVLKSALSSPGVYQGTAGDTVLAAKKAAQSLGFDVGGVADSELAQKIGSTLALQLRDTSQGAGMAGSMSNEDREFLVAIPPGLTTTPEGNVKAAEWMIRVQKHKAALARIAQQHVASGKFPDAELAQKLQQYADENPIFTQEDAKFIQKIPSTGQPSSDDGFTIEPID